MTKDIQTHIEFLPNKPGVYQFFNAQGDIIYIGKAKDLKKRVSSYFNRKNFESAKLRVLVSKVVEVRHIIVDTESDALLLENNLIKKHKPRYNILLKDDKTYPWICIKNEPFPRIFSTRRIVHDGSKYFGPYTSGFLMNTILDLIRSLYPLRNCNHSLTKHNIESGKFKACLEYQIGNCMAPCIGQQDEMDYNENINSIVNILNGNLQTVRSILVKRMHSFSKDYHFEEAQKYKEKIDALDRFQAKTSIVSQRHRNIDVFSIVNEKTFACVNYIKINNGAVVQSHNLELKKNLDESESELLGYAIAELRQRIKSTANEIVVPIIPEFKLTGCKYIVPTRGEKQKLLELSRRNAKGYIVEKISNIEKHDPQKRVSRILQTMQKDFRTPFLPIHIECFDNSNLQGTNPVAACVVFRNGKPSKKEYRLFNIKTVEGPNDFASMEEVVRRRYSRLMANNEPLPQLIVIDGGKGQLSSAYSVIKELKIQEKVQVIGIAKRLEEIFFPGDTVPLYLDKNSESLKVIQNARNEAHRFGVAHHRRKRSTKSIESELSKVKGIGEKTLQILFKTFKSIENIKNANLLELEALIGSSKSHILRKHFNSEE